MSGPARSGAIVYAADPVGLAVFYRDMFGLVVLKETSDFVSLGSDDFNLVVHTPPCEIPEPRFNAVKVFLTVDSLEDARHRAERLGGSALPGAWSNPFFVMCNIADPEGNHIQLREFT